MAGKCASINAEVYDATPFTYSEENSAIEHFGELLTKGTTYLEMKEHSSTNFGRSPSLFATKHD